MRRVTYDRLTTGLVVTSALFMVGSPFVLAYGDLDNADFLLKIAVMPGGFLVGGLIYLSNGLVEYYADLLPTKYRDRSSQLEHWRATFSNDDVSNVQTTLQDFAAAQNLRSEDAFQFHPDDHLWTILSELYTDRAYPDCLELSCEDSMDEYDRELAPLMARNATLKEYVATAIKLVEGR